MKIIHKNTKEKACNFINQINIPDNSIFIDIETTGFSAKYSYIYLIGTAHIENDNIITNQFFAPTPANEPDILKAFISAIADFDTIITFNGQMFDIPFIESKCQDYNINCPLKEHPQIDIFKEIHPIKTLLNLENYKQQNLETFLNIYRKDSLSGKELIDCYKEYIKKPTEDARNLLFLHNYEDIIHLPSLYSLLNYSEFLNTSQEISDYCINEYKAINNTTCKELIIELKNNIFIPKEITYRFDNIYLLLNPSKSTLRIPIYNGVLKHFYSNYKDYYYLPDEDMAIHKSIATYVDKDHRKKCTAKNCFTKKDGSFLPQYDEIFTPVFKTDIKDNVSYFETTEDFFNSKSNIQEYTQHIINTISKNKKRP
ncbi:MAG: ribonuclease H-like domain-containing protein [Agathobacter sp.]|nr:ribonuclease H-like domain-containing protein [Agathobacter sp.]